MKISHILCWVLICVTHSLPVHAAASTESTQSTHRSWTWLNHAKERITRTYQQGALDLYLTGYTWHSSGYTREQRNRLNSYAYGGGLGKRWADENGHEDLIYAFAFIDSHNRPQPIVGYARQWFIRPIHPFAFGAGFTAALTARADARYIPFPLVLPVASVRVARLSMMATIIPRLPGVTKNRGSVVFIWARYAF